jgi:putative transposase
MSRHIRKERHSISDFNIHLVCVTKYRQKIFNSESLKLIEKSFKDVALEMNFQILEFNVEKDHIHVLIE